jgi:predicted ArsR family transcriptional regulator
MSVEAPNSDADLLDLLRIAGPLRVSEMAEALEVTPTAVRQRLARLMSQSLVQREAVRSGRGRPRHQYWLTEKGLRLTGSNFTDLALTLWRELRAMGDPESRREILRRIAKGLAEKYADQIRGTTANERMHALKDLLAQRRIPATVQESGGRSVLTTHACPYPNLADHDKSVCTMERLLFSELVGRDVDLAKCRLEGDPECQFHAR